MKLCLLCATKKPLSGFNKNCRKHDGHQSTCRECTRIYRRSHYLANKAKTYQKIKSRLAEIKLWYGELRQTLQCAHCGFDHPATIDFHHLDPTTKERDISRMIHDGWSRDRIKAEIKKCITLCANCHSILHYELGL